VGAAVRRPGADRRRTATLAALRERGEDHGERGQFLCGWLALHDPEKGTGVVTHSGMFPCFFGGSVWRLFASTRSALVTWIRVCDGGITASTYPRSAAM